MRHTQQGGPERAARGASRPVDAHLRAPVTKTFSAYQGSAAGEETYGSWAPSIAFTASSTAVWTIARCAIEGAPWPAPGGVAVAGDCSAAAAI
jgi:hypothetical protein